MKYFRKIVVLFIKGYQYILSPYWPGVCRYTPTCSNYSIAAFNKYGFFKGFWFSIKRIVKCHPWGGSGHDPLP
ncbi:MAG: membrane protein insertion efficiency factor YidD [Rickettsiales bacterium]|nr:membrane protein insertion efficiency factor YidD [Rickettsiales bacterium]